MKKINKIKLSSLSNEDLNKREMNKLLGGGLCCICNCVGINTSLDLGNDNHYRGIPDDWGSYYTSAVL